MSVVDRTSLDMDCRAVARGVGLYLDGELDAADAGELEAHAMECDACRSLVAERREAKERLRALAARDAVPTGLRERLQGRIAVAARERRSRERRRWLVRVAVGGASVVVAAAVVGGLAWREAPTAPQVEGQVAGLSEVGSPVVREAIDWHRRNVPVEVTGPYADVVGAWFGDKLPFAVRVPELEGGVSLLGARLGHIHQHEAAYIVYEVGGRKLSVMVFDARNFPVAGWSEGGLGPEGLLIDNASGFNVALVRDGDIGYSFTSELPEERLRELVASGMVRP